MSTTEYRLRFVPEKGGLVIYLGKYWIGNVYKEEGNPLRTQPHYVGFLRLPEIWGPVVREDTLADARAATTESIEDWLEGLSDGPQAPPEPAPRVRRTRNTPPPRITRTRQ